VSRQAHLGHVPALDGIRGLAVLLVLAGHADIPGFEAGGGFTGVTIFFVLSGFLITALLIEEHRSADRIDLPRFYARRALRLLPALVVYVLVVSALTWNTSPDVIGDAAASLFYVANWVRAAGEQMEYLDHIWSLSIEEQFYFVWPVVLIGLIGLIARRPRAWASVLFAIAGAIMVERFVLWSGLASLDRIYFATDTRADALLVGCGLAIWWSSRGLRVSPWVTVPAALVLVLVPGFQTDATFLTLGTTSIAVVATAILIAGLVSRPHEWSPFGWTPLAWVGRISYGLYLWHFAFMLAFYGPLSLLVPAYIRIPILFAGSFALAIASYYIVERPFLRLKDRLGRVAPSTLRPAGISQGVAVQPD
jgi:peptidoglycan/LPS O-acetylase OafA/YrhL